MREVQKYAAGKLLYIPSREEKRAWGEMTGYREQLQKRNRMIRNKYAHGLTVSELADEYFLSLDSIKKIIYAKPNDGSPTYSPTIASAAHYAAAGMIEEWMQCYLQLTLDADPAIDDLMREGSLYFGVVKFPLRLIRPEACDAGENLAGVYDDDSETGISPLIILYEEGKFLCTGQPGRVASLKQRKINAYPSIIVLKGNTEYRRFMKYYGNVLMYVDK